MGFILPQQQDLTAEVELLKSRTLARQWSRRWPLTTDPSVSRQGAGDASQSPADAGKPGRLAPTRAGRSSAEPRERAKRSPAPRSDGRRHPAGAQVQVLPNSSVIEVRYRSTDPERAVNVVNTLLKLYLDRYLELRRPHGVTAFFASQRTIYEQKLRDAEAALRDFEGRTALINASAQLEVYSRQLAEAELTLLEGPLQRPR